MNRLESKLSSIAAFVGSLRRCLSLINSDWDFRSARVIRRELNTVCGRVVFSTNCPVVNSCLDIILYGVITGFRHYKCNFSRYGINTMELPARHIVQLDTYMYTYVVKTQLEQSHSVQGISNFQRPTNISIIKFCCLLEWLEHLSLINSRPLHG